MYTLVLTHDIDYLSLKEIPWFCRTLWGFSYRCFLAAFTSKLGTRSFRRRARVLWDGISMPLIKLGWRSDPWASSLEQMIEIEKHLGVRSTIYFLPFPNQPGSTPAGMAAPYNRTSFYDVGDHSEMLRLLESEGWEIGLHGINAYWDESSALEEKGKIEEILGHDNIGIRMHWLYYNHEQTWSLLSRVGFRYDATHGWNEKVG
ncbi:MAG TPA: hypothetical protein VK470_10595, partial [Bacteroidota bacterium]|nr:hypothetical protein [Bacteroidota bacterium]